MDSLYFQCAPYRCVKDEKTVTLNRGHAVTFIRWKHLNICLFYVINLSRNYLQMVDITMIKVTASMWLTSSKALVRIFWSMVGGHHFYPMC